MNVGVENMIGLLVLMKNVVLAAKKLGSVEFVAAVAQFVVLHNGLKLSQTKENLYNPRKHTNSDDYLYFFKICNHIFQILILIGHYNYFIWLILNPRA